MANKTCHNGLCQNKNITLNSEIKKPLSLIQPKDHQESSPVEVPTELGSSNIVNPFNNESTNNNDTNSSVDGAAGEDIVNISNNSNSGNKTSITGRSSLVKHSPTESNTSLIEDLPNHTAPYSKVTIEYSSNVPTTVTHYNVTHYNEVTTDSANEILSGFEKDIKPTTVPSYLTHNPNRVSETPIKSSTTTLSSIPTTSQLSTTSVSPSLSSTSLSPLTPASTKPSSTKSDFLPTTVNSKWTVAVQNKSLINKTKTPLLTIKFSGTTTSGKSGQITKDKSETKSTTVSPKVTTKVKAVTTLSNTTAMIQNSKTTTDHKGVPSSILDDTDPVQANNTGVKNQNSDSNVATIYVISSIIGISLLVGLILFLYMKRRRKLTRLEMQNTKTDNGNTKKSFQEDLYSKVSFMRKKSKENLSMYDETIPLKDYCEKPLNDVLKIDFVTGASNIITNDVVCVNQNNDQQLDLMDNEIYETSIVSTKPSLSGEIQIHNCNDSSSSKDNLKPGDMMDNNNNAELELIDNDAYEKTAILCEPDTSFDEESDTESNSCLEVTKTCDNPTANGHTNIDEDPHKGAASSTGSNDNSNGKSVIISEYLIPVCHRHPPPGPNWRPFHAYDPVYVPTSNASAMNRLVDNTGYVSRKRPDSPVFQLYEEINYGQVRNSKPPPLVPRMTMGATASGGKPPRMLPIPPPGIQPYIATSSINNNNMAATAYSSIVCSNHNPILSTSVLPSTNTITTVQNDGPIMSVSAAPVVSRRLSSINIPSRTSRASSGTSKEEMYETVDFDS